VRRSLGFSYGGGGSLSRLEGLGVSIFIFVGKYDGRVEVELIPRTTTKKFTA
jgi:hypothetical protein